MGLDIDFQYTLLLNGNMFIQFALYGMDVVKISFWFQLSGPRLGGRSDYSNLTGVTHFVSHRFVIILLILTIDLSNIRNKISNLFTIYFIYF